MNPTTSPVIPRTLAASPADPARRTGKAQYVVLSLAGALIAVWVTGALMTTNHGFDKTDEGLYLLSYRWWNADHRSFTGVQYIYGPVFQLLHHSIPALRMFRLITVLAANAYFGWSFMRWLRPRRPSAPSTRAWEAAGTAVIVAAAAAVYGWMPLSPGYNDVVLLGATVTTAQVLRAATAVERGVRIPAWVPVGLGAVAVPVVLTKWAAGVTIAMLAAGGAVLIAPAGLRAVLRAAAWALAGCTATVAAVNFLVVPLRVAIPPILEVTRWMATHSMTPGGTLETYKQSVQEVLASGLRQHWLLLVAALATVLLARGGKLRRAGWVLAIAALGFSVVTAVRGGGLAGGLDNAWRYAPTLLMPLAALCLTAATVLVTERRQAAGRSALSGDRKRGWFMLALIFAVPFTQSIGSGIPPQLHVVNAYALWMAVMVAVATGIEAAPEAARMFITGLTAVSLAAAVAVGVGGQLLHPYRTASWSAATATVPGVPQLSSVRLDPRTVGQYAALRAQLDPYMHPEGRRVIAILGLPGVVYLLGGRTVGEGWYSARDQGRMWDGIVDTCRRGRLWGDRLPILLFSRPPARGDVWALRACHLSIFKDYRKVPAAGLSDVTVYLPLNG